MVELENLVYYMTIFSRGFAHPRSDTINQSKRSEVQPYGTIKDEGTQNSSVLFKLKDVISITSHEKSLAYYPSLPQDVMIKLALI